MGGFLGSLGRNMGEGLLPERDMAVERSVGESAGLLDQDKDGEDAAGLTKGEEGTDAELVRAAGKRTGDPLLCKGEETPPLEGFGERKREPMDVPAFLSFAFEGSESVTFGKPVMTATEARRLGTGKAEVEALVLGPELSHECLLDTISSLAPASDVPSLFTMLATEPSGLYPFNVADGILGTARNVLFDRYRLFLLFIVGSNLVVKH